MRRALLAGAALVLGTAHAWAQMAVIDAKSIAQLMNEISLLKQQYSELQSVYASLAHPTGVLGMAPELYAQQNPLGGAGNLAGIISGNGSSSPLTGLINQIEQQNQAYRPTGTDWTAQWINRSATSNAGVQALAQTMLTSLQQRQVGLTDLQGQLATANDVTEITAIGGRLQTEQNFVSAQQTEASLLQTLALTQAQAEQQQVQQRQRQDADEYYNDTQALP